jgi:hypothetical protein
MLAESWITRKYVFDRSSGSPQAPHSEGLDGGK